MLRITVPEKELWDERNQVFIQVKEQTLQLEHSLVSLSKWESKWRKSFLKHKDKSLEETIDYVRCMTITQNVNPNVYLCLTDGNIADVNRYITDPMTATYLSNDDSSEGKSNDVVTAELIYYWMIAFNIPVEFQKWHLNRLLTLIRVCEMKNRSGKKKNPKDIMRRNRARNAYNRKRFNSKG